MDELLNLGHLFERFRLIGPLPEGFNLFGSLVEPFILRPLAESFTLSLMAELLVLGSLAKPLTHYHFAEAFNLEPLAELLVLGSLAKLPALRSLTKQLIHDLEFTLSHSLLTFRAVGATGVPALPINGLYGLCCSPGFCKRDATWTG